MAFVTCRDIILDLRDCFKVQNAIKHLGYQLHELSEVMISDDVVKGAGMMMTHHFYMLPLCGTWGGGCCHKTAEVQDDIQPMHISEM